jgi:DNA ligase-1
MQQPWKVIEQLSSAPSRLDKEKILLNECLNHNTTLFDGFKLALNSLITFGIKKIPVRKASKLPDGPGISWEEFLTLSDALQTRAISGIAAITAVNSYMSRATTDQWDNWYRRILLKSLRCGVSETTINKVVATKYPMYLVPSFGCQLAYDSANHLQKLTGEKLLELKLDGIRALSILYPHDQVIQHSRTGRVLSNFSNIRQQLESISHTITTPMVLDGEITSINFQKLMTQVNRKYDVTTTDANYLIFDMLPLSAFTMGEWEVAQRIRSNNLASWYNMLPAPLPNVQISKPLLVNLDTDAGKEACDKFYQDAIANGFEGIMIKDPNAPYRTKKWAAWLKRKPAIEVSLTIVGVEEGEDDCEGTMGAILCEGVDDGKFITVSVGGGFSRNDRDDFWNNRNAVLGDIVEVKADAITKNSNGTYSLRFPRIRSFRGFSPGEKL